MRSCTCPQTEWPSVALMPYAVRNRSSEGADGPAHTDTDTEMGYRDKGKGMCMDEFLQPNPNPKPGELRTVPQWPHKRPPQPQPTCASRSSGAESSLSVIFLDRDVHASRSAGGCDAREEDEGSDSSAVAADRVSERRTTSMKRSHA